MSRALSECGVFAAVSATQLGVASARPEAMIFGQASELKSARATVDYASKDGVVACRKDMAEARKDPDAPAVLTADEYAGVPKAYTDKDGTHLELADTDEICNALEKLIPAVAAHHDINEVATSIVAMKRLVEMASSGSGMTKSNLESFELTERKCRPAVAVLKAGGFTKMPIHFDGGETVLPVADYETRFCDGIVEAIKEFKATLGSTQKADKEWAEKAAAPYKKAGAAGAKLEFLIGMEGRALYAVGGRELTTPQTKARASVMFEVLTGSDGSVTIKRYAFKGNVAAGQTQRDYPKRPSASAYK